LPAAAAKGAGGGAAAKVKLPCADAGMDDVAEGDGCPGGVLGERERAASEEPVEGGKGRWGRKGSGEVGVMRPRKRVRADFGEDEYEYELQLHLDALEHERKPPRDLHAGAGVICTRALACARTHAHAWIGMSGINGMQVVVEFRRRCES